jgi:pimeloyl-ACP methyl ester carboxylesterase
VPRRIPAGGAVLDAYEMGGGPRGVVLVPELGRQGMCGWWSYAGYLARAGFRVLGFDHRCTGASTCPDPNPDLLGDIDAATRTVVADGAGRVVLVGASQGGAEVVIAGARPPAGVVGIVALSADELSDPLAAPPYAASASAAAATLHLPSLFAVADRDPNVSVVDTQALEAEVPDASKRLIVLPAGQGHGWDLVAPGAGGARPAPSDDIVAFLNEQLTPPPQPCPGEPPARLVHAGPVPVDLLGTGSTAIVLSNQSDEDRCAWVPFANTLVGKGFTVALWDYGQAEPPAELAAVVRAVRGAGVDLVLLVGASKGAKTSLVAARQLESTVAGVVSLSAEAVLAPGIDVASASAGLAAPVLLVTAAADPYGSAEALDAIRRGLVRAQVLSVPGSAHGTALLADPAVSTEVLSFLGHVVGA